MALGRIGVSQPIADVDTEHSAAAIQCRTYYDQAVKFCLEKFPWPFATSYRVVSLVAADPVSDWEFAYRYPTDCLFVRRIVTELGRSDPNPPPFRVGQDTQGKLIYTSVEDAEIEYTANITNPGRFSAEFVEAVSWKLGSDIAPALTRIASARKDCLEMALATMTAATTTAANEQQKEEEPESEFISARA